MSDPRVHVQESGTGDAMDDHRAWTIWWVTEVAATGPTGPPKPVVSGPVVLGEAVRVVPASALEGAVDLLRAIREPIEDVYQDSGNWPDLRDVRRRIDAFLDSAGGR